MIRMTAICHICQSTFLTCTCWGLMVLLLLGLSTPCAGNLGILLFFSLLFQNLKLFCRIRLAVLRTGSDLIGYFQGIPYFRHENFQLAEKLEPVFFDVKIYAISNDFSPF